VNGAGRADLGDAGHRHAATAAKGRDELGKLTGNGIGPVIRGLLAVRGAVVFDLLDDLSEEKAADRIRTVDPARARQRGLAKLDR
jgi:predicted flap endonuclease-1-like 5' DNA nuclease